jgi:HSP20 family protein
MRSFTPKFDVKEVGDVYELHGDLPGIEQSNVEIEFTDSETLTIKGRTERSYTSGTPPAGLVEGSSQQKSIEGQQQQHKDKDHQPTVEDEDATNGNNTAVEVHDKKNQRPKEPEAKYWVSERSVGEFSRSFTFPVRVDQDGVKASMKNGVLTVVVPKARKTEARKITIQ